MERVGVATQDLLNGLVAAFSLAISLSMVSGGEVEFGAQSVKRGAPKRSDEARVTVRNNDTWDTM